jgi:hypothetical protein
MGIHTRARIAARIHLQCGMHATTVLKPRHRHRHVRDQQEESSGLLLTTQREPDSGCVEVLLGVAVYDL